MRRHHCKDCATGTFTENRADYPWANDPQRPYIVWARHIHTGKLKPVASFQEDASARQEVAWLKTYCTSHEAPFIERLWPTNPLEIRANV